MVDLKSQVGQKIILKGIIAKAIWQHPTMVGPDYPFMEYFDPEDGNQIVIYTKTEIPKSNTYFNDQEIVDLEITGTVIEFQTHSKGPPKEEKYTVQQILVDTWKIL